MFCMKCGKPTEGDRRICPECEAVQAAQAAPVQPAPQAQPVYQPAQQPVYQPNPYVQQPAMNLNLAGQAPEPKKPAPKKKKKGLLAVIASVLAVVVLFSVLGFAFWDLGGTVSYTFVKLTKDEKGAALYVEEKAMKKEGIPLVSRSYGGMIANPAGTGSGEASLNLKVGDPIVDLISQNVASGDAATVSSLLAMLQNIRITLDAASAGDAAYTDITLGLNNVDILTLRMIADYMTGETFIGLPDLQENYLAFDLTELGLDENQLLAMMDGARELSRNLPDEDAFNEMVTRYVLVALSSLKNVEEYTETLEIDGVKQRLTVYTYRIDESAARDMLVAVLKEAQYDGTLQNMAEVFCQYYNDYMAYSGYYYSELNPSELFDSIPYMIEELESVEIERGGESIRIETYVNGAGNICGRALDFDGFRASYLTTSSGSKRGFEVSIGSGKDAVKIVGSGKELGGKLTGTYSLKYMGYSLVDFELEKFHTEDLTGTIRVTPGGTMDVLIREAIADLDAPWASLLQGGDLALELVLTETTADVTLLAGGQMLLDLGLSAEETNNSSIPYPEQYTYCYSEEDIEQWLAEIDLSALLGKLEEAGLPGELLDLLGQADFGGYATEESAVSWAY